MKRIVIYIHGKGGNAKEANHYKSVFKKGAVVGLDYKANNPWDAKEEISQKFDALTKGYDSVILIANSIGAFFSMYALEKKRIDKAFFISPIVDMNRLIKNMMFKEGISEEELEEKKEIKTSFGETLSIDYLNYVRENPINWRKETHILYAEKDNMTTFETMVFFAQKVGATLNVMENAEHWIHGEEEMKMVDEWIRSITQ